MPAPDALRALPFLLLPAVAWGADCVPERLDLRDGDSTLRFQVEVADDATERAQGLMCRESMPKFSGMLFVYETPQPVAFWMRNTLIPLDMLFFDGSRHADEHPCQRHPARRDPDPGRRRHPLRARDQRRARARRSASRSAPKSATRRSIRPPPPGLASSFSRNGLNHALVLHRHPEAVSPRALAPIPLPNIAVGDARATNIAGVSCEWRPGGRACDGGAGRDQ